MAKAIVSKHAQPATEKPTITPRKIGDDEQVLIPVTRSELAVLFNAASILDLMHTVENKTQSMELVTFAVLLDTFTNPTWELAVDLQNRFRDQELLAAGERARVA